MTEKNDTPTPEQSDKPEKFDKPSDNTVENSQDEMGAGYGGPAPVTPEDEQA